MFNLTEFQKSFREDESYHYRNTSYSTRVFLPCIQPLNFRLSKWVSLEKSNDTSSSKPINLMAGK